MQVCVVGGGFVGVANATVFAEWGHDVELVEVDARRRHDLAAGRLPFHEVDLEEAWRAASVAVLASVRDAQPPDVVFLCVGTPSRADGSVDLEHLEAAAAQVASMDWEAPLVVKSTVPPGTTMARVAPLVPSCAMSPEFLREGGGLHDARQPDRVVLGVIDQGAQAVLERLYARVACPVVITDPTAAEMVKYAANAMLATRVALANEIGNVCQAAGVNVDDVMEMVGMDVRIGPHFLKAGVGFGGSCFPKDLKALRATASSLGVVTSILDAVLSSNETQPAVAVDLLAAALGGLDGKEVALLGLAFKPGTSDVRGSRALPIYQALVAQGARVVCYDPKAMDEFARLVDGVTLAPSAVAALQGVDGCIIQTEWPEFRELAAFPPVVVDGRRHLDREKVEATGSQYWGVGDGRAGKVLA